VPAAIPDRPTPEDAGHVEEPEGEVVAQGEPVLAVALEGPDPLARQPGAGARQEAGAGEAVEFSVRSSRSARREAPR
jgi:hypothetical protein